LRKLLAILVLATLALVPAVVLAAPLMEGDFNGDGHVNIVDAMAVCQYTVDPTGAGGVLYFSPTADNVTCGDVNDDGTTNIIDAMLIAQWTVDPTGAGGILAMPLWQSPADDGMAPPAS
jgi:hypothetical protein